MIILFIKHTSYSNRISFLNLKAITTTKENCSRNQIMLPLPTFGSFWLLSSLSLSFLINITNYYYFCLFFKKTNKQKNIIANNTKN